MARTNFGSQELSGGPNLAAKSGLWADHFSLGLFWRDRPARLVKGIKIKNFSCASGSVVRASDWFGRHQIQITDRY